MMGLWSDRHAATIDPNNFRAHDQFLEQRPDFPYRAICDHIRSRGLWDWVTQMGEDGAFGCVTEIVDGVRVSRDLLDSVLEIAFLHESLPRYGDVLDIGSGYGRLAHRMSQSHALTKYWHTVTCTDAIPQCLDVCNRYLKFRNAMGVRVVPPDVLGVIKPGDIGVAVNIHSWSECTLSEIDWWLDLLDSLKVLRLFIVPHTPDLGSWTPESRSGEGPSYRPYLTTHGWKLGQSWHGPECNMRSYYLFERA